MILMIINMNIILRIFTRYHTWQISHQDLVRKMPKGNAWKIVIT